jgi:hypothetical protein
MNQRESSLRLRMYDMAGQATCFDRCVCVRWPIGFVCLLSSVLIVSSMCVTLSEKMLHSDVGVGFVLERNPPGSFNPMDELLISASAVFPLDYVIFGSTVLYVELCTLVALAQRGIRVFCLTDTHQVREKDSSPQAMLMTLLAMMLMMLSFFVTVFLIAPQVMNEFLSFLCALLIRECEGGGLGEGGAC